MKESDSIEQQVAIANRLERRRVLLGDVRFFSGLILIVALVIGFCALLQTITGGSPVSRLERLEKKLDVLQQTLYERKL